jgi:hypothetical protein
MTAEEYLESRAGPQKRAKGKSDHEEFDAGVIQFSSPEFQKEMEKRRICRLIEEYAPHLWFERYNAAQVAELAYQLAAAVIERCNKL